MKKTVFITLLFITSISINAQKGFYVSLAGGVSYKASEQNMSNFKGTELGSYGEGIRAQLRGGYFFNDRIGVELGVGYLHGDDQKILNNNILDVVGRARAYGASLSGIYNISKNVYVRGGLLTKIGGKTEISGEIKKLPYPDVQKAYQISLLKVNSTRDNTGNFPLGFTAAFGVKLKLAEKWGVFAEMEYEGINVDADKSTLTGFTATLNGRNLTNKEILAQIGQFSKVEKLAGLVKNYALLLPLLQDEYKYVENPSGKPTEVSALKAPYSSFGFSLGFTYYIN